MADKKIVVGTNAEYEPFEYLNEDGKLTGFDIDLMNALGEKMGVKIEWVDMAFDSLSRIVAMSFCEPRSWTRVLSS